MPPLLNKYEEITYEKLKALTIENGAHVFPKVRVADVLPIQSSGISNANFKYALQAHFDFVICGLDYMPLFVVEFDGLMHKISELQKIRDAKKNSICEFFSLPLLRINARYLTKKYRDLDLLTYFIDVWFLEEGFLKAQKDGHIPWDEPFDPTFIWSDRRKSKSFPYWLSLDLQNNIKKLYNSGAISDPFASHWIGIDSQDNYRCLAWLQVNNSEFLIAQTGMRQQQFPVDISDLLSQLSVFDLYEGICGLPKTAKRLLKPSSFEEMLRTYNKSFKMVSFGGYNKYH